MLTGELKGKINRVWEAFWMGGLANPLTVIEQMTYLLFIRRLDELQVQKELQASFTDAAIRDPGLHGGGVRVALEPVQGRGSGDHVFDVYEGQGRV